MRIRLVFKGLIMRCRARGNRPEGTIRGGLPLSEVALAYSLSDRAHLAKTFRRVVGPTPSAWRRARRDVLENT
jgi:AraC-like DNA-binding protein